MEIEDVKAAAESLRVQVKDAKERVGRLRDANACWDRVCLALHFTYTGLAGAESELDYLQVIIAEEEKALSETPKLDRFGFNR